MICSLNFLFHQLAFSKNVTQFWVVGGVAVTFALFFLRLPVLPGGLRSACTYCQYCFPSFVCLGFAAFRCAFHGLLPRTQSRKLLARLCLFSLTGLLGFICCCFNCFFFLLFFNIKYKSFLAGAGLNFGIANRITGFRIFFSFDRF